jgi:hypothetical protein
VYKSKAREVGFIGSNVLFNCYKLCIRLEVFVATRLYGVTSFEAAHHEKRKSRKLILYYALILDKYRVRIRLSTWSCLEIRLQDEVTV